MEQRSGKKFGGGAAGSKNGKRGVSAKPPKSLKNQIRGVERLLKRPDLDLKMRARQEAKLEELRLAHGEHQRKERERKYAVRYHKVRFFERVKLERRLQRLQAQAAKAASAWGSEEALAQLQRQIEAAQEDLQYVLHFPKGEKYVSLLRQAADPEAQERLEAERARLRVLVQRQMAEAAMLAEADEGAGLARGTAAGGATAQAGDQAEQGAASQEEPDDFFLDSDDEEGSGQGAQPAGIAAAAGNRPGAAAAKRKLQQVQASEGEVKTGSEEQESSSSGGEDEASGSSSGSEDEEGVQEPPTKGASGQAAARERGLQHLRAKPQQGGKPWQQWRLDGSKPLQQRHGGETWKARSQQQQGGGPWKAKESPKGAGSKGITQRASKPARPAPTPPSQPLRSRAEGGRKRRKKG